MTPEAIAEMFARRHRAWANRDVAAFAADYAHDCVIESPTLGTVIGREAVQAGERRLFAAFPDITVERDDLIVCLLDEVQRFTDNAKPTDDQTVLVLSYRCARTQSDALQEKCG